MSWWPDRGLRVVGRVAVVLGAVAVTVLLSAGPAAAHAVLVGSDPPDGAVLVRAPQSVRLTFSEDIAARLSTARLVDGAGRAVDGTRVTAGARELTLVPPGLATGAYGVIWQVTASDDGHTTGGVVLFSVGDAAQATTIAAAAGGTGPAPFDVALRWLRLCLLAGLVGGLAFAGLLSTGGPGPDRRGPGHAGLGVAAARRRLLGFVAVCGGLGAVVGAVDAVARPGGYAVVAATRWGQLWAVREAALVVLAGLAVALRSRVRSRPLGALLLGSPRPSRVFLSASRAWVSSRAWVASSVSRVSSLVSSRALWVSSAALVLVSVSVEALASHAAALDTAAVAVDAVHVLAACLWLGAVAAAALVGVRVLAAYRVPFTRLAIVAVGLVAATGLYHAGRQVDALDELWTTPYGRALLVKSALVLLVAALGLANSGTLPPMGRLVARATPARLANRPGLPRLASRVAPSRLAASAGLPRLSARVTPSRWLVVAEVAAGALVLLVAGVLAETTPARAPVAAPAAPVAVTGTATDLVVSVTVTPNRPGVNGFTVLVASTRRPPPAPVDGVSVAFTVDDQVTLRQVGPDRYFGTATVDATGPVRMTVLVSRAGARVPVPVAWSVAAPPAPRSDGRLAPAISLVVLLLVGGVLAAGIRWLWVVPRRRRPADIPAAPVEESVPALGESVPERSEVGT